jgi:hypothetical protein
MRAGGFLGPFHVFEFPRTLLTVNPMNRGNPPSLWPSASFMKIVHMRHARAPWLPSCFSRWNTAGLTSPALQIRRSSP